jgi:hypothetical protein
VIVGMDGERVVAAVDTADRYCAGLQPVDFG